MMGLKEQSLHIPAKQSAATPTGAAGPTGPSHWSSHDASPPEQPAAKRQRTEPHAHAHIPPFFAATLPAPSSVSSLQTMESLRNGSPMEDTAADLTSHGGIRPVLEAADSRLQPPLTNHTCTSENVVHGNEGKPGSSLPQIQRREPDVSNILFKMPPDEGVPGEKTHAAMSDVMDVAAGQIRSDPAAAAQSEEAEEAEEEVATGKVERAVKAVATAVGCDICGEVMRDPVTAPECMHSFCAACIDEYIYDLQARSCPVCQLEGVDTNLGNMPYHHHRLQFDFTLADVTRKLFPRPEVERQIEVRRRDERRFMEQAKRKGQQSEESTPAGSPGSPLPGFAAASADLLNLLLLPVKRLHDPPAAAAAVSPIPAAQLEAPLENAACSHPSAKLESTALPQPGPAPNAGDARANGSISSLHHCPDLADGGDHWLQPENAADPPKEASATDGSKPPCDSMHHTTGHKPRLADGAELDRPYLRLSKDTTVGALQQYLAQQLRQQQMASTDQSHASVPITTAGSPEPSAVTVLCKDQPLSGNAVLGKIYSHDASEPILVLQYRYQHTLVPL